MRHQKPSILSAEDQLRLRVLLEQSQAIRIDESRLRVEGYGADGVRSIGLRTDAGADALLRAARQFLADSVLGQSDGFPVYIRRWTRGGFISTGQARKLLLLAEPEAIHAVAALRHLDAQTAALTWWSNPHPGVARLLLSNPAVAGSPLGIELAEQLLELLPFEPDFTLRLSAVRLILGVRALPVSVVQTIWDRGQHHPEYRAGYLLARPDNLPDPLPDHRHLPTWDRDLLLESARGNRPAVSLRKLLSASGQTFLREIHQLVATPENGDSFVLYLNLATEYIGLPPYSADCDTLEQWHREAGEQPSEVRALVRILPATADLLAPLIFLGGIREHLFHRFFARTTATGSLLRSKLSAEIQQFQQACRALCPAIVATDTRVTSGRGRRERPAVQ